MDIASKIVCLDRLGKWILTFDEKMEAAIEQTYIHNRWFTKKNCKKALTGIANQFLEQDKVILLQRKKWD